MNTRISVIGTGYLGATHAASMAELGFEVIGIDTDPRKVRMLNEGIVPFSEPGLPDLLRRHVSSGRLRFSTDLAQAARHADVHFICVGTPQARDGLAADLSAVEAAVQTLARSLRRDAAIIGKSTVPVGTADRLAAGVAAVVRPGLEVSVSWNPEFLREGHGVHDTLHPDRLVFGVTSPGAEQVLRQVYAQVIERGTPVHVTSPATAELAKVAANAFLATKISFINAMAELSELAGADVVALAAVLGDDPRIGRRFLDAGVGFGGGCLPKDIRAFQARAQELGVGEALRFLHEVDLINQRRRQRVVQLAAELLDRPYGPAGPDLGGIRVTVLGATFKPNSDDVRDSPALSVVRKLSRFGADVTVYDPEGMDLASKEVSDVTYKKSLVDAVTGAELVCVLTEWEEFRNADPKSLGELVAGRKVIDGRNCLDQALWVSAGWEYRGMGRPVAQ